jgi:calnexin
MVDGVVFDNFLLTSDQSIAKQYADQIWYPKSVLEGKAISSASESVVDAIVNATKDRPWLWAVYLVAILLPLVIIFVFCWSRKSTKKTKTVGLKKKTDESEPDTNEQQVLTKTDDDEETEEIEIDEQQVKPTVTTATSKDALENDEEEEEQEEEEEEQQQQEEEEGEVGVDVRKIFLCFFFDLYFIFSRPPKRLKMKVIKIHHHQLLIKHVDEFEKNNSEFRVF